MDAKTAEAIFLNKVMTQAPTLSGMDGVDGLGAFGFKSIKKAIRHTTETAKNLAKKKATFAKLSLTNPRAAAKMLHQHQVKSAKESIKVARKVAPVVAAAAAVYFGGPVVLAALKAGGAATALKGATTVMSIKQAADRAKFAKLAAQHPQEATALKGKPPEVVLNSPLVKKATAEVLADEQYAQLGVNMSSPEAQNVNKAIADEAASTLAVQSTEPPKSPVNTALMMAAPLLLMKFI